MVEIADEKIWYVYILKCNDNTLYTGVTNDLDNRLHQHNHGQVGAKYTRARRPVTLVYSEEQFNKSEAMKREHVIDRKSVV